MAALLAVIAGLGVLATLVVGLVLKEGELRQALTDRAGAATGRDLSIEGDVTLDLLTWTPSIVAQEVTFGNPPWASRPEMARIGRLVLQVDLRAALRGTVRITGLSLEDVDLLLERDDGGRANWQLEAAPEPGAKAVDVVVPERRAELPLIERLHVRDGRITYASPTLERPIVATFADLEARRERDRIAVAAQGTFKAKPFRLEGKAGDFAWLRAEGRPYPVAVELAIGATRASITGNIAAPLRFTGFDAQFALAGSTLREIHEILGLPLPPSPIYELTGRLKSSPALWRLEDFRGRLGGSDLAGDLQVDTSSKVPLLRAEVRSRTLDFKDLAGFLGETEVEGAPRGTAEAAEDELFVLPDDPIDLGKLRTLNAQVTFKGERIQRGGLLLNDVQTRFALAGGRLEMKPLDLGLALGTVAGTLIVDARAPRLRFAADMRIRGVDLGVLLAPLDPEQETRGRISGRIRLEGQGRSVHDIASRLDGEVVAYMNEGVISHILLEAVALDLPQVISTWFGQKERSVINCMILPVTISNGVARFEHLVFDAAEDTIIGKGFIDLGSESLQVRLIPYARDFSLFNAPSSVVVNGNLATRTLEVDKGHLVAQLAKKLLLAPFVPFLEMMKEDEVQPCRPVEEALKRERAAERAG